MVRSELTEAVRAINVSLIRETYPLRALMRRLAKRPLPMRTRTDLLNYLIHRGHYTSYLEIGVRSRSNFDRVRAHRKTGVDPAPGRSVTHQMTSDEFFRNLDESSAPNLYDLVFIDGEHLADQVERDVANSLDRLAPGGAIVLHDCNPLTERAQLETYDHVSHWNGTVWKAWVKLRSTRPDLSMVVVDIDHGCGVIRRGSQQPFPLDVAADKLDYGFLQSHRRDALNLIGPVDFQRLSGERQEPARRSLLE